MLDFTAARTYDWRVVLASVVASSTFAPNYYIFWVNKLWFRGKKGYAGKAIQTNLPDKSSTNQIRVQPMTTLPSKLY
jgi:hypothetical protein